MDSKLRGINGHPLIPLDEYIPVEPLLSLHQEICLGIAKSAVSAGIYGPSILEASKHKSWWHINQSLPTLVDGPTHEKLSALSHNQRSLFFKLRFGLVNPL